MILTINKKDYLFEYSIEASLYSDCTQTLLNFMLQSSEDNNPAQIIGLASDLPRIALTLFYAGLLEHHGVYGDGSVKGIADAKALLAQYLKENESASYYSIIKLVLEQMGEDGFFQKTGLMEMISEAKETQTATEENEQKATARSAKGRGEK